MWYKYNKTEEEIYNEIAENYLQTEGASEYIADEIFRAKFDSDHAVHCFFSPSKSNGWAVCPAYLDRAKQWDVTKEPAIRGTITHHFLSKCVNMLKGAKFDRELDTIMSEVLEKSDWLSPAGVDSVRVLLSRCVELGIDKTWSEVFVMSPTLGMPNQNLRFGGSIDVLHIKSCIDKDCVEYADTHIYDLKTGKHVVSPNCWQLKCYAMLVQERFNFAYHKFTLGIAQNGKLTEYDFSDVREQDTAFLHIKNAMNIYGKEYLGNRLNVDIDDARDMEHGSCFQPCQYCRFCKGCFKREVL